MKARDVPFNLLTLASVQLHQFHTGNVKMFLAGEIAQELFEENPTAFLQELRQGRYVKINSQNHELLYTISRLGLPVETRASPGVALLPPETVEQLLADRRKGELVQPFKLALLKLASQEAAHLMAGGQYDAALPIALEAVKQGQALFQPQPAIQLFPLYLLAAQAQLGLRRSKQCEDLLGLASWLAFNQPAKTTHTMRSQLSRLYGQLYAVMGKHEEALQAFAEDVYYCSLEHGPEEVRTSLGYYNLAKVFQGAGSMDRALACTDQVVTIWFNALQLAVLGIQHGQAAPEDLGSQAAVPQELPLGRLQLAEVIDMLDDICKIRASAAGPEHESIGDVQLVAALACVYLHDEPKAAEHLQQARSIFSQHNSGGAAALVDMTQAAINSIAITA